MIGVCGEALETMSLLRRRRSERGHMIILFAMLIVPVSFALGVVAVDASLWQSERRGAQKDADLSALAGAVQLALEQHKTNAENAAISNANANDEAGNAVSPVSSANAGAANTVVVDDACYPDNTILPLNAVSVNLNHGSRTFFASVFGVDVAPDIGAHARACVGSLTRPEGLRPFAIPIMTSECFVQAQGPDYHKPNFGQECTMDWGSQDGPGGADRGIINLERGAGPCSVNGGGSREVLDNIMFGAGGDCYTQSGTNCPAPLTTCVLDQTGNVAGPVSQGIRYLIDQADDCDTNGDGRDDFSEAVQLVSGPGGSSPNNVYAPNICSDGHISERIITIVATDWLDKSNDPWPIRYFIPVYILGCRNGDPAPLELDCPVQGGHVRTQVILFNAYLSSEFGEQTAPNDSGTRIVTLDE
jgi:hypothetical protein